MWCVSRPARSSASEHARERLRRAVGEDVARGEVARVRILLAQVGDAVVEQLRAGPQRAAQAPGVLVHLLGADVLDHADRGDGVERLAGELAVVDDAEVGAVRDPGLLGAAARGLDLRRRQRDAGDVDAVALGGVDGERAPAAADVEHVLAPLEAELLADELELGLLRLLEVEAPREKIAHE